MILRRVALGLALGGLLAGCGIDTARLQAVPPETSTTLSIPVTPTTVTTIAPTTTAPPVTDPPTTEPTTEPATTEPTTTEPGGPTNGVEFQSDDGVYHLTIGPDWEEGFSLDQLWNVADRENGFRPNVKIREDDADGGGLADYLAQSNASLTGLGFQEIANQQIVLADGTPAGYLEYTGTETAGGLHFLAIAVQSGDQIVLATFTAPIDRFAALRPQVEPYLRTLRPGS